MSDIAPLKSKLQKENSFYKIMLKIRAAFSKKDVEAIYNIDLLAEYAKSLNKNKLPIINIKNEILEYGFYQRFIVLKESATFFKQFLDFEDDELGDLYFELVKLISPEFSDLVNKKTDPSILSQDDLDNGKANEILISAMIECVDSMDEKLKSQLQDAITQIYWLINFTNLPFEKFSVFFQKMPDGLFVAYFLNIIEIYSQFCTVLTNYKPIRKEVFDALFEYNANHKRLKNPESLTKENLYKKIMEETTEQVKHITTFFTKNELITIGKIIFKESTWLPPHYETELPWVENLKSAWQKSIETKWVSFVQEVRKSRAFEKMQNYFSISEFPMLPNRPWTAVRQRTLFSKEYSTGFMNWYVANLYDDSNAFYKNILKEGDFVNMANRNDFSEALNLLEVCSNQLIDLNFKLASNGKFGQVFTQIIDGNMQYFRAQTHIENMMTTVEIEIQKSIEMFMKSLNLICNVFSGFSQDPNVPKVPNYEGLKNFTTMKGTQNGSWVEKYNSDFVNVQHVLEIMKELIVVDGTK